MSDSKINKKNMDIMQSSNIMEDVTEYNSNKIISSTDLLIQFLSSVMTKHYEMALKYCMEILKREPNNLTALEFYPLIVEKLEMVKEEEEFDTASSDSSASSSSTSSSSSESNFFPTQHLGKTSPRDWRGDNSSCKVTSGKKNNSSLASDHTGNGTKDIKESSISLNLTPKKKYLSLPKDEGNSSANINGIETPLPSNLLIHATQTITLIGNNASNTGTNSIQQKKTPANLQEQSSKILLRTTPTITFPRKLSPSDWTTTDNLQ